MKDLIACTIASKNYISYARVLASSFLKYHPDGRFFVLLVDQIDEYFEPGKEEFTLIEVDDLDIKDKQSFYFKYNIVELNTAVKPFFLDYLFKKYDFNKIAYFDPDILITDELGELSNFLDTHSIILTPHITRPIEDNLKPDERDFLLSGTNNLGFIALRNSETTTNFLEWWKKRLYDYCLHRINEGLFVDQKWVDLVPSLFGDVFLLREPNYNVAYWNLHERNIQMKDGFFLINNKPLKFYHFSGFLPDHPWMVSKYKNRFTLRDRKELSNLFEKYRSLLYKKQYKETSKWPYKYSLFSNGEVVTDQARLAYIESYKKYDWGNPFIVNAEDSFYNWLLKEKRGARFKNRVLEQLLRFPLMQSVKYRFRSVISEDLYIRIKKRILRNMNNAGVEIGGKEKLHKGQEKRAALGVIGINIAGYVKAESGVGEAARSTIRAIDFLQVPFVVNNSNSTIVRKEDSTFENFSFDNPFSVNCVHVNADQMDIFYDQFKDSYFEGKYNIGYWLWETSMFPKRYKKSLKYFDEIWSSSAFSCDAIATLSTVPVVRVPLSVDVETNKSFARSHFSIPDDKFVFLFVFDFLSVFDRKNPLAIIKAFKKAFSNKDEVLLILKCVNGDSSVKGYRQMKEESKGYPIKIINSYLSRDEIKSLLKECDCYVSLHRSEGFGYGIAEAMQLGKPVIATAYSGNMDFMTVNNSFLVRYDLVKIEKTIGPYESGNVWADPDIEHASELIRFVYDNKDIARKIGEIAMKDTNEILGIKKISSIIKDRLDVIEGKSDF